MAKIKDAWRVATLLLDLNRMWAVVNEKNPITPKRIVDTLRRLHKFFIGGAVLLMLTSCQSKVSVRVYKHTPEPDLANERSLLVPTQVIFDEPVVEAPKPERSVLVRRQYDVIITVDEGRTTSRGSGTLYRPDAVVTCYHLFADSKQGIDVKFPDGTVVKGKLIHYDKTYDLACVQIPPVQYAPAQISDSKNLKCEFAARGYGKADEGFREVRGRFVRWTCPTRQGSAPSTLVIDQPVRSGDSGGGIFNDGGLYGVIWGSVDGKTYGTSGAGFRQFIRAANEKLDRKPVVSTGKANRRPVVSTGKANRLVVYSDPNICAPCKQLSPILEALRHEGYNVTETKPTSDIPRMPTLVFFDGDVEVAREVGFQDEATLKTKLRK